VAVKRNLTPDSGGESMEISPDLIRDRRIGNWRRSLDSAPELLQDILKSTGKPVISSVMILGVLLRENRRDAEGAEFLGG
jgi:hypothetical protein